MAKNINNTESSELNETVWVKRQMIRSIILSVMLLLVIVLVSYLLTHPSFITLSFLRR